MYLKEVLLVGERKKEDVARPSGRRKTVGLGLNFGANKSPDAQRAPGIIYGRIHKSATREGL